MTSHYLSIVWSDLSPVLTRHCPSLVCPSQSTSDPESRSQAWSPPQVSRWPHISKETWAPLQSPHWPASLLESWSGWRPTSCPRPGGWCTRWGGRAGRRRGRHTGLSGSLPPRNSLSLPGSWGLAGADLIVRLYCDTVWYLPPFSHTYNLYQAHTYIGFKSKTNFHK